MSYYAWCEPPEHIECDNEYCARCGQSFYTDKLGIVEICDECELELEVIFEFSNTDHHSSTGKQTEVYSAK